MEWSITLESFIWGLSNDKNAWPKGAFYDSWNIDIRRNNAFIQLARWVEEITSFSSKINAITLNNYSWGAWIDTEYTVFHEDGTISNNSQGQIWKTVNGSGADVSSPIHNVVNDGTNNWIIAKQYIYSFTNAVRSEIITTNTFASGWTGTNWSFTSGATHTTGSTVALTQSSPITTVIGQRYHITCDVTSTAWTCTVSIWGATSSNLTSGRNDVYLVATTTAGISFTPSSTFDGTISYVRVDRVSELSSPDGVGVKYRFTRTVFDNNYSPALVWNNADIIIGSWNSVSRINKDGTLLEYSSSLEQSVIWGLAWVVRAITQVGNNIYVWCNGWGSTILYIWDGMTNRPSEKIIIADKPVINCALLNNEHYWWTQKGIKGQKYAFQWAGYQNNPIVKSDIPRDITAISSYATGNVQTYENDRLCFYWEQTNAIETFGDIVYLPWYGKIFGFWRYYPWNPVALDKSFVFNGTECTAMFTASTAYTGGSSYDYSNYMLIAYERSWAYKIGKINLQDWATWFASQGYIDTLEYMSSSTDVENEAKKYTLRFYLPHSSTSIKVYKNVNQAWFTLDKTIDTTSYWTGFNVAEISDSWTWDTLQWRFELITSNSAYTPRLYIGFKNKFYITEKK